MSCPVFPKPVKTKASLLKVFFTNRHSWLDALYYRSYKMKMGHVRMPGLQLFIVNQPNLLRRIMIQDVDSFPKHGLLGSTLEPLLGESIFTTNGALWKKQRDMMDPAFELTKVQHVFDLMQAAANGMEQRLEAIENEPWVDIDHEITIVTADIIFRTIMSSPLEPTTAKKMIEAFSRFQSESTKLAIMKMFRIPVWLFGTKLKQRCMQAAEEIRSNIEDIIRPRYEASLAARSTTQTQQQERIAKDENTDLLSTLLAAIDKESGQHFSFKEIIDQVSMLFLAGHETSASALTWSLYLLALYPDVQKEAYTEIMNTLDNKPLNVAALKRMTFLRDIFREALRLYPPVGFLARECAADSSMRDKTMRKGSIVMISPWLLHRHHDLWDRPNDFDPYRFSKNKLKVPLRDSYMPFGSGKRVCIGAAFAQQEASLILATLLKKYHFEIAPDFTPKPVGRLTIRSENGMHLILKRRSLGRC